MLPEPIVCLRCAFPRTVRLGPRRVCFQCRFSWFFKVSAAVAPARVVLAEKIDAYPFTSAQLVRLLVYRRAVQARFYSDELGPEA